MSRSCAVTGYGAVSAAGAGIDALWQAVLQPAVPVEVLPGRAGPREHLVTGRAAPARDPNEGEDRAIAMAADAIEEALDAAGHIKLPAATQLVVGTTLGATDSGQTWHAAHLAGAPAPRGALSRAPLFAVGDRLAERFGIRGGHCVLSNACASGATSIGLGLDLIRSGEAEVVIAGGVDVVTSFNFTGFATLGLLTRDVCVPFDPARRNRMLLGEAAAFVVLESLEAARHRARAELAGFGCSFDAFRVTRPASDGRGAARAMVWALEDARIAAADVDCVCLNGVATYQVDAMEAAAIEQVFADVVNPPAATSLRPVTGHTLGAVGALDGAVCVRMLEAGCVPGTSNARPGVLASRFSMQSAPVHRPLRVVLKSSWGFGGINAALAFRAVGAAT